MIAPLERAIARWYDAAANGRATLVLLVLFVAAWTLFHSITYAAIGLHPDLTEVYGWGRHPAAGYYKHPPLAGLISAAWFALMPASDWAFHLLAMIEAAVGLYLADLIARRYLSGDKRLLVLLLLLMLPFYQFHGQRFNANTVLIATWPLATYCFLRAFETRGVAWSLAAGAAAALAMLGKYYSIYLIGGIVIAALAHPGRLGYLRSLSPWLSMATGFAVLAPHLDWLVATGFQPFDYAYAVHGGVTRLATVVSAVSYLVGAAGYAALPLAVYWLAVRPNRATLAEALWPADPDRRMPVILFGCFLLLPPLSAPLLGVLLTSLWTMHVWFLLPVILLMPASAVLTRTAAIRIAAAMLVFTVAAVLLLAPALAWRNFRNGSSDYRGYSKQLSADLTREWRATIGLPLAIVMGDARLSAAVSFYSADHPDSVPGFELTPTPWISPQQLLLKGWAGVCAAGDAGCVAAAAQLSAQEPRARRLTLTVVPRFLGHDGVPGHFVVVIVPPNALASSGATTTRRPAQ